MKKIGMFLCLALAGALLFSAAFAQPAGDSAVYLGESNAITTVTLRLFTLDGEILFDGPVTVVDKSPTVYMALMAAADAKGLALDVSGDSLDMLFLNGIGDLVSENPAFWMYYVNQSAAELGMGTQPLAAGDVVEFLYGDYSVGYQEITAE